MTMIYGHKWSAIAETDDGTWLQGLRGLSPEQVAHGISQLIANLIDWPPSLPEFIKLCIDIDDDLLEGFVKHHALSEYDGFYINQMTQRQIDDAIKRARKTATKLYFESKLKDAIQINIDQLKLS